MIVTQSGPQNIGQIEEFFSGGMLFLSPDEYQREGAWKLEQKRLLVDTVFRRMDIPKFYLWKIDLETLNNGYPDGETKDYYHGMLMKLVEQTGDPKTFIFEAVDGQQRLRTLLEYMGITPPNDRVFRGTWHPAFDALDSTPMAKGAVYLNLHPTQKTVFKTHPLTVMVLENATMDEIRDMFLRLQNGTPLNAQQKRDSYGSNSGRAAKALAEEDFFRKTVPFGNNNSQHVLVTSQILNLVMRDDIMSCTSRQLDKLYTTHKATDLSENVAAATKTLGLLYSIFPQRLHLINRSYALSLFWFLHKVLAQFTIATEEHPQIRKNFEKMELERLSADQREYSNKPGDDIYFDLTNSMSKRTDGKEGIGERHRILGLFLLQNVTLTPRPSLDPNRNFTFEEKAILFGRCGGVCQLVGPDGSSCGKQIEFEDAVVDHIVPHSRKGKTELGNGRITFNLCNIARGNRDAFDPATMCHLRAQAP